MILRQMGNRLYFHCPGCNGTHCVQILPGKPAWGWNGSFEKPTFTPSVLYEPDMPEHRCHFFVRDGQIQFLEDCHHKLKGQTVPMEDFDGQSN